MVMRKARCFPKMNAVIFLCIVAFLACLPASFAEMSPAIEDARASAAYLTKQNPRGDAPLLDEAGVRAANQQMLKKNTSLHDLAAQPGTFTAADVKNKIAWTEKDGGYSASELPEEYEQGRRLTWQRYAAVLENMGLSAIPAKVVPRYGVVVSRANLRLLPSAYGWFSSPSDVHYDDLQATALDPSEPVLVLVDSADQEFSFIISRNYCGWLRQQDFALTDRRNWMRYVSPEDFAVVTAHRQVIGQFPGSKSLYQMGAKIPCEKGNLLLPARAKNGSLILHLQKAAFDENLHHGFLPCTENNFVRQGMKFLGDVYGWGGLDDSVDCSAFTSEVYRSMGLEIPRNADAQGTGLPRCIRLSGSTEERLAQLKQMPVGTLLSNDVHVMMYVGQDAEGTPLIMQSMSSWFDWNTGGMKKYLRRVILSTATFPNSRGVPYIDGVNYLSAVR